MRLTTKKELSNLLKNKHNDIDKEIIKIHAEKFDKTIFQRKIIDFIESKVQ